MNFKIKYTLLLLISRVYIHLESSFTEEMFTIYRYLNPYKTFLIYIKF